MNSNRLSNTIKNDRVFLRKGFQRGVVLQAISLKSLWMSKRVLVAGLTIGLLGSLSVSDCYAGVREDLLEAIRKMTLQKIEHLELNLEKIAAQSLEDPSRFRSSVGVELDKMKHEMLSEIFKEAERTQLLDAPISKICTRDESANTLGKSINPCFEGKANALNDLHSFVDQQFLLHQWVSEKVYLRLKDALKESFPQEKIIETPLDSGTVD